MTWILIVWSCAYMKRNVTALTKLSQKISIEAVVILQSFTARR